MNRTKQGSFTIRWYNRLSTLAYKSSLWRSRKWYFRYNFSFLIFKFGHLGGL